MGDLVGRDYTQAEARARTDQVRFALVRIDAVLLDLHDRRAHVALDYPSWEAYVRKEFDLTRRRSYQLVARARVTAELGAELGTPCTQLTDLQVRTIGGNVQEVADAVRALLTETDLTTALDLAVSRLRQQKRAVKEREAQRQPEGGERLSPAVAAVRSLPGAANSGVSATSPLSGAGELDEGDVAHDHTVADERDKARPAVVATRLDPDPGYSGGFHGPEQDRAVAAEVRGFPNRRIVTEICLGIQNPILVPDEVEYLAWKLLARLPNDRWSGFLAERRVDRGF